jgi:2,5-diamino-6-(ribosylamino)-4(3H)-pyrimidinone 5'-phosphate reductase
MTVDGKIATSSGDSKISSREDLVRVHKLRASVDAIVVGISTILADNPQLTVRLAKGKNPARVIVDSRGRIPLDSQIMRTASRVKTIVAVTDQAPDEGKKGESAAVPHGVNLKLLFRRLEKMGLRKILVEGGGELNWSLLYLWLVDELTITIAPKIAGGRLATTLVEGDGFDEMAQSIKLQLKKIQRKKGGELVLHYKL